MKTFITGATGFIGSHLTRRLVREGFDVHVLCRKDSDCWRLKDIENVLRKHIVALDDRDGLRALLTKIQPDYIFHLAVSSVFSGAETSDAAEIMRTNFIGTMNLMDAAAEIPYRCFINTGSSAEYGLNTKPMKETDRCAPILLYGVAKLGGTLYGQMVARTRNKPIVTIRPFSPYGPQDDVRRLIPTLIARAQRGDDLSLSHHSISRDYIFIDDLIDLYWRVMQHPDRTASQIYNGGSGSQTTFGDLVKIILQLTESKSKVHWGAFPKATHDTNHWQADIAKAGKSLEWKPRVSLEKGLRSMIF